MTMLSDGMLLGVGTQQQNIAFMGKHFRDDTSASQTFTGVDIGAADGSRIVAVVIFAGSSANRTVSSVTIGGVSATVFASPTGISIAAIAYASVPSGTTANINVVLSGAVASRLGIAVYRVISASPTPADTDTVTAGTTKSMTLTGGTAAIFATTTETYPQSVTGTTNATVDYDFAPDDPSYDRAQVSGRVDSPTSAFSVTITTASSVLIGACWA